MTVHLMDVTNTDAMHSLARRKMYTPQFPAVDLVAANKPVLQAMLTAVINSGCHLTPIMEMSLHEVAQASLTNRQLLMVVGPYLVDAYGEHIEFGSGKQLEILADSPKGFSSVIAAASAKYNKIKWSA